MAEEQNRGPQNGEQVSGTDKFMSKVKEMADTVDKTVSEQIESIKIKSKISSLNDEIDDFYRSIGIKVYQSAEENFVKSDFQAEIQNIEQRFDEIEQYLGRAARIRGVVICAGCGKECQLEDEFCSKCGRKLK